MLTCLRARFARSLLLGVPPSAGSPISSMSYLPEPPFTPLFPIYLPLSSLDPTVPNHVARQGVIPLPRDIFGVPLRKDVLHQCVCHHRSLQKIGSKHVLGRAEVRGSGRKLHRQKGTGRARVGDSGSGIREWPHPLDRSRARHNAISARRIARRWTVSRDDFVTDLCLPCFARRTCPL